ncbi:MAG TPA: 2-dehydropantoate 2-reductase [Iamia sp.]|nr:2-dehydropantoate 2-reductase [Iamia sp.]
MRVAVVGVGAIGGFAAARVAEAGHEVVLCARRPFATLVVEEGGGRTEVAGPARVEPAEVAPVDWVLLATKVHQVDAARTWLPALCGPATAGVLTLQNGLGADAEVAALAGGADVVPSVVHFGAELVGPGHVRHHGAAELLVPAAHQPAVRALFGPGLAVAGVEDFTTAAWRKLVVNVMSGPLMALTRRRLEALHDPEVALVARRMGAECVAVARRCGAGLDDATVEEVLAVLRAQPPTMGGSMLYDRLAGRPLERDAITGAVVTRAAEHGVAVPTVEAVHALLGAAA